MTYAHQASRLAIVLSLFASISCKPPAPLLVSQWKSTLERAVAKTDRVIISIPGKTDPELTEIADTTIMAEFIAALEIDEAKTVPNQYCRCVGDVEITLYRGETELASLWLFHDYAKWFKGQWPGDAKLTQASRDNMEAWVKKHANISVSLQSPSGHP